MRKLSDQQIKEALRLRKEGHTLLQLANRFEVHFTTIALWTGPEERRKIKLAYKKRESKPLNNRCKNCGINLHDIPPNACDCNFPSPIRRYFFSPKDLLTYN